MQPAQSFFFFLNGNPRLFGCFSVSFSATSSSPLLLSIFLPSPRFSSFFAPSSCSFASSYQTPLPESGKKKIFVGVFNFSSHNVKGIFLPSNCGPIKTDLGLAGCHLLVSLVITLNTADCSGLCSRKDAVIRHRKKTVDFVTMLCRTQRQQILRWTRHFS